MAAGHSLLRSSVFVRLWLATFAVFSTFGALLLALPLYANDALGASDVGVGIAVGAASITAIVCGPPSGRLADRRGRRALLVVGAAMMVVGYLALGLEPSLALVIGIRLFAGVGEALFAITALTIVTDLAPAERRGEAISLATVASYGGLAAGPVAANLILGDDRYAAVWIFAAVCAFAAGAIAATLPETRPEPDAPAGWLPPRGALRPGLVLLLALLGFGGFNAFAALYAREIGFERPGVVFALFGLVIILVRSFGRRVPDRLGGSRTATVACGLAALGLATVASVESAAGLLVGTAIFATGQALTYPAVILLATADTPERERGAMVGSVTAFVDVALAFGAMTLGGVAELAGYRGAFLAGAAAALGGLMLVASGRRAAIGPKPVESSG